VGLHCVWDLAHTEDSSQVVFVVSHRGLLPRLLELVGVRALILIDAVDWGGPPGAVTRWVARGDTLTCEMERGCSSHAIKSVGLALDVIKQAGHQIGWVGLYWVQPASLAPGVRLNEPVDRARRFLVSQFCTERPWLHLPELPSSGWIYDRQLDEWMESRYPTPWDT